MLYRLSSLYSWANKKGVVCNSAPHNRWLHFKWSGRSQITKPPAALPGAL